VVVKPAVVVTMCNGRQDTFWETISDDNALARVRDDHRCANDEVSAFVDSRIRTTGRSSPTMRTRCTRQAVETTQWPQRRASKCRAHRRVAVASIQQRDHVSRVTIGVAPPSSAGSSDRHRRGRRWRQTFAAWRHAG